MKKRLLNEETTRRFMKLANLSGLSESFVTETETELEEAMHEDELEEAMHEDEMEEDMYEGAHEDAEEPMDDMPMDDEPEMDMDDEPEMDMEPEPEMDMGDDAPAGDLDASAVINAVAQATLDALKGQGLVSDETTVAVDDADGDDPMPEPEMDMDMDMEPEMDADDDADLMETTEDTLEETTDETLEETTETVEEQDELTEEDAFVAEVVRRVAERILAANKNNS